MLKINRITEISSGRDVETAAPIVTTAASCPPCSDQRPQQGVVKARGSVQAAAISGG